MMHRLLQLSIFSLCLLLLGTATANTRVDLEKLPLESININHDTLFPESVTYNPISKKFVVGSFRLGAIFEVDKEGNAVKIIEDQRLRSVFAISIDSKRNKLYALTSDMGVSTRTSAQEVGKYAALGIYDLTSGNNVAFIDLSLVLPERQHLVNGMTLDNKGNAYITDSFAAAIYKFNINTGKVSLFLQDNEFEGEAINLNGLVYHTDGYLIVAKKSNGILYKIPVDNPAAFSPIISDQAYLGADGVVLADNNTVVIIANRIPGHATNAAFFISTQDNWKTAKTVNSHEFGEVYPTTGVMVNNHIYAVYSKLNQLVLSSPENRATLRQNAFIQNIGSVQTPET